MCGAWRYRCFFSDPTHGAYGEEIPNKAAVWVGDRQWAEARTLKAGRQWREERAAEAKKASGGAQGNES